MFGEDLREQFHSAFDVVLARSPARLEQAFALRGLVFSQELGYWAKDQCPEGLETDAFDRGSAHVLLIHRRSGIPAGYVRLVLPQPILPIQSNAAGAFHNSECAPESYPATTVCEISRLAVPLAFRAGREGTTAAFRWRFEENEQRAFPFIAMALFLGATSLVVHTRRRHVFAQMDRLLPRLLGRAGLHFRRIGDAVPYKGLRAPFYIDIADAVPGIEPRFRPLYEMMYKMLGDQFPAGMQPNGRGGWLCDDGSWIYGKGPDSGDGRADDSGTRTGLDLGPGVFDRTS